MLSFNELLEFLTKFKLFSETVNELRKSLCEEDDPQLFYIVDSLEMVLNSVERDLEKIYPSKD